MLNSDTLGIRDLAQQIAKWNQPQSIHDLDGIEQKWQDDRCQETIGIYTLDDIASKTPCDAGVNGIEDIAGINGYFEPEGTSFCSLLSTRTLLENDLFLISRHDDSTTSRKVTYKQLSGLIAKDIINALNIKSMAFEMKSRYAVSSHNHDDIYSHVEFQFNERYASCDVSQISTLGRIQVTSDYIDGDQSTVYANIDLNPSNAQTSTILSDMIMPKIVIPYPPKPMIGTLRFIGVQTLSTIVSSNNLILSSNNVNVNPYDDTNKIRDDFDGWVFPNGITMPNIDGQLSDASLIYTGSPTADIVLPNVNANYFLKMNPSLRKTDKSDLTDIYYGMMETYPYNKSLLAHAHNTPEITMTGTPNILCVLIPYTTGSSIEDAKIGEKALTSIAPDCGNTRFCQNFGGTPDTFTEVTSYIELAQTSIGDITTGTNSNEDTNEESYPPYRLLPVMMYIGGETRSFYENLYAKYHQSE